MASMIASAALVPPEPALSVAKDVSCSSGHMQQNAQLSDSGQGW